MPEETTESSNGIESSMSITTLHPSEIELNIEEAELIKAKAVLTREMALTHSLERSSNRIFAEAQTDLIKAKIEKVKVETVIKSSMQMVPGELVELEAPASNNLMLAAAIVAISILGLAIAIVIVGIQILTKL